MLPEPTGRLALDLENKGMKNLIKIVLKIVLLCIGVSMTASAAATPGCNPLMAVVGGALLGGFVVVDDQSMFKDKP